MHRTYSVAEVTLFVVWRPRVHFGAATLRAAERLAEQRGRVVQHGRQAAREQQMPFRDRRDHAVTSRRQMVVAAASCLLISALAGGAVSQSPSQKATSDTAAAKAASAPPDQDRGKRLYE